MGERRSFDIALGAAVQNKRKSFGLNQKDFADMVSEETGVKLTKDMLMKIESGETPLRVEQYAAIRFALDRKYMGDSVTAQAVRCIRDYTKRRELLQGCEKIAAIIETENRKHPAICDELVRKYRNGDYDTTEKLYQFYRSIESIDFVHRLLEMDEVASASDVEGSFSRFYKTQMEGKPRTPASVVDVLFGVIPTYPEKYSAWTGLYGDIAEHAERGETDTENTERG